MKIKTLRNGNEIEIIENKETDNVFGGQPCKHAKNIQTRPTNRETYWTLERILIVSYDSNCAAETICLDCLLEEINQIYG